MEKRIFLNKYRLSRGANSLPVELHRTPTSVTYRAQEIETGREVALEHVIADTSNPGLRELLESEAASAREIKQINVPTLYDYGVDEGELIYVTEYFDGHTASAWVAAQGPLATTAVLHVALQVVAAMDAMAFRSIHHHALNPDNMIFVDGPTAESDWPPVRVLHWLGVAPLFAETGNARLDNAAKFASPEQLYTGKVDVRSEIFSLGCTMWFLLTGAAPAAAQAATESGMPALPMEELHGVPKIVSHLIARMLRFEPHERPQDPLALGAFLQTCLSRAERREKRSNGNAPAPFVSKTPAVERKTAASAFHGRFSSSKPLALAAALIALALLAAFAVPRFRARPGQQPLAARATGSASSSPTKSPAESATATPARASASNESKIAAGPVVEVPRDGFSEISNEAIHADEPPPPEEGPEGEIAVSNNSASARKPGPPIDAAGRGMAQSERTLIVLAKNGQDHAGAGLVAALSSPAPDESEVPGDSDTASPPQVANSTDVAGDPALSAQEPPDLEQSPAKPPVAEANPPSARSKNHSSTALVTKFYRTSASKSKSVARKSSSRKDSQKSSSRSQVAVKRAKAIPELHFGSSRAELVGTTSDGHWILVVPATGKRFIVPPPPGFARK
ncbi:MAG: protein kinase [Chthoniobacterales bacterium]